MLLVFGYFSVCLGDLRGLRRLHLAALLVLYCGSRLIICSLIWRRSRTERPAKPRTEEINEAGPSVAVRDGRIQTKKHTSNAIGSPSVWAPESALWRSLRLAGLFYAARCLSGVTLKEIKQGHETATEKVVYYAQTHKSNFLSFSILASVSAYILSLRPGSARSTPALLLRPRSTILPFALPLHRRALVLSRLRLVAGPRAAREEPSTEAAFVGCVPAAFDRDAAWPGDVGCFRALRANKGEAGFE